jgi:hypothetical protein
MIGDIGAAFRALTFTPMLGWYILESQGRMPCAPPGHVGWRGMPPTLGEVFGIQFGGGRYAGTPTHRPIDSAARPRIRLETQPLGARGDMNGPLCLGSGRHLRHGGAADNGHYRLRGLRRPVRQGASRFRWDLYPDRGCCGELACHIRVRLELDPEGLPQGRRHAGPGAGHHVAPRGGVLSAS